MKALMEVFGPNHVEKSFLGFVSCLIIQSKHPVTHSRLTKLGLSRIPCKDSKERLID